MSDKDENPYDGLLGNLNELFERLAQLDDEDINRISDAGSIGNDNVRIDFDYSVSGLSPASPSRKGHPGFENAGGSMPTDGSGGDADEEPVATVAETDEGAEVTVDLAGTGVDSLDDLDLSVVGGRLIVADDGATLVETELPVAGSVAGASYRNGVLAVTIE